MNLKNKLYMQPYRDVFMDCPVEYVQKCINSDIEQEKKRKKGILEKTLLFLKLKKPWQAPRHVIYSSD